MRSVVQMERPSSKLTQEVVKAYIAGIRAEMKAKKEGTFNPSEVRAEEGKKKAAAKAKSLLDRGVLSAEIVEEVNCLDEDIKNKTAELKDLYGIDVEAGTLAAAIEANNLEIEEVTRIKNKLIEEKKAEIAALQVEYNEKKAKLDAKYLEDKAEVEAKLEKDKEEAKYDLERTKKVDNDSWTDDKNKREAVLAGKESAVVEREKAVSVKEKEFLEMKAEVEALPAKIAAIEKSANATVDAEVNRILGIKKSAIEKEAKLDMQLLQKELDATKENLKIALAEKATAVEKLDAAYKEIAKTAQSSSQQSSKESK